MPIHDSVGKLILRIVLGLLILLHGIHKLAGGVDWLDGMLANEDLPVFFKYGAYIGEVIAPLLLIAGWYSRIGAWLIAVNMLFAFGLFFGTELLAINAETGGLAHETEYIYMFAAIALGLIGPGRYAFNQK